MSEIPDLRIVDGWIVFRIWGRSEIQVPLLPTSWKTRSEFSSAGELIAAGSCAYELFGKEKSRMPGQKQYLCPMWSSIFGVDSILFIETERGAAVQSQSIFLNFVRIFG